MERNIHLSRGNSGGGSITNNGGVNITRFVCRFVLDLVISQQTFIYNGKGKGARL